MNGLPGRRAALRQGGTIRPATVIAVVAPLVTVLALVVQAPADPQDQEIRRAPAEQALTSADLFCPAIHPGAPARLASSAKPDAKGSIDSRLPGSPDRIPVPLAAGGTLDVGADAGLLLHAEAGLAVGLHGAVLGSAEVAARECTAPGGARWFLGAGSGASHLSTLTMANPDAGPAVADVSVWSTDGPLDEIESRGLTIQGGEVSTLPLEQLAPHASELAVRVVVGRGRLAVSMADSYGAVGEALHSDGLHAGAAPARVQVIPGLTRGATSRVLTLVNPGADEARVTLGIAGARSTFAPSGVDEIIVPAGRVVVTDLTAVLAPLTAQEDVALVLTSTQRVAAGLRSMVAGDLIHNPALTRHGGPVAGVVPAGGASVVAITAGAKSGEVTVRWDNGTDVAVPVAAGTTVLVGVPPGVARARLTTTIPVAAVLRTENERGATLIPMRLLVSDLLVPAVRPEWPPN